MTEYKCKLCRALDEWDLGHYDERMLRDWQRESGRKGYRTLAREFNTMLLRRQMDRAGVSTLANEAESRYERLTGDDETVAHETREVLQREGLPIDDLESDFVSYGVIRKHLTECLGEEYEHESGDWEQEAIVRARSHAQQKISEAVQAALSKGKLSAAGDVTVSVSVELECERTQVRVPVDRAMRRGHVSKPATTGAENPNQSATDEVKKGEKR